ncbi:hypothetical protein AVEN_64500-1 [Araneus ventricosus]|uniref:Uncharacterized protein n=1 Tax=Araneus ventricosus TaxID=182803 RepID=A0A4Y2IRH5_ARAVE|nr:hypothetical protein AVEN_64500-1 [Araneus ventricosus]
MGRQRLAHEVRFNVKQAYTHSGSSMESNLEPSGPEVKTLPLYHRIFTNPTLIHQRQEISQYDWLASLKFCDVVQCELCLCFCCLDFVNSKLRYEPSSLFY